jgi:hypothetical protein
MWAAIGQIDCGKTVVRILAMLLDIEGRLRVGWAHEHSPLDNNDEA